MRGFLFFLIFMGAVIWYLSAKKLLKYSKLQGAARYILAVTAFPLLVLLSIVTMLLWVNFSPYLLSGLEQLISGDMSNIMKTVIIAPIFSIVPLAGIYFWWNIIKYLDKGSLEV